MDKEISIAIIGGLVTIVVGLITAFASYIGAIRGSKLQIEKDQQAMALQRDADRKKRQLEYNEEIRYRRELIERIISHEIKDNFLKIKSDTFEREVLYSDNVKDVSIFFRKDFSFVEFDQAKYELIKYQSDKVSEVMLIYDAFKIIKRREMLKNFTPDELRELRKAYLICKERYS